MNQTSVADFAVGTSTASTATTGPVTDPVRARKKGVVGKALDAAKRALTSTDDEPTSIPDDDDAAGSQPVPGPAASSPALTPELAAFAARHGIPSDVKRWILSECKTQAQAVLEAHRQYEAKVLPTYQLCCIRTAEKRLEELLTDLPSNIDAIQHQTAVLAILRNANDPLCQRLGVAAENFRRLTFHETIGPSLQQFIARLRTAIGDADAKAEELDRTLAALIPGLSGAKGYVSRAVADFRSQFSILDASRTNPVLANCDSESQFVRLAQEAANT